MMAARNFNKKQALEKEVKDIYAKFSIAQTAATASLATTTPIVLTSIALGPSRNTNTFTLEVEAAAANPTDTILADFTGTAAAIVCTITPNDGTNNSATPVDLTTEELVELINTGAVVGKTVTVTDASSLRNDQTATGGDDEVLVEAGEGDGEVATFASGAVNPSIDVGYGISSITWNSAGNYSIVLSDSYYSLKYSKLKLLSSTAQDIKYQVHSETVSSTKIFRVLGLTGTTPTDPINGSELWLKLEVKNSGV